MRRSVAGHIGSFSLAVLVTAAVGSVGVIPAAQAAPASPLVHATMIPAPGRPGVQATTGTAQPWASRNWSGYAITGSDFTSVTGHWTVPTVIAPTHKKSSQYSSTWVGIDGFEANDDDLIQAGTEQDWNRGAPEYHAWWEILPAPETMIKSISVHPGDSMSVAITQGSVKWTITVTDTTDGQSFTTKQRYSAPLTSAEWIQEAPTVGGHIAKLAHDSTVDFDLGTADGISPDLVSSDSGSMVKRRKIISIPSAPNPAQDGFAVAFGHVAPPAPTV
jgi:hypothetical protein